MKHTSTTVLSGVMFAILSAACGEVHSEPSTRDPQRARAEHEEERRAEVTHILQPGETMATPRVTPTTSAARTQATSTPVTPTSAAPTAAPTPANATLAAGSIRLARVNIARGIENRAPVDPNTQFDLATLDKLYVYMEGHNSSGADANLRVTFTREGSSTEVGGVSVTLPATTAQRAWRTWAFTRGARTAGNWTAHVRAEDGTEIASVPFTITG